MFNFPIIYCFAILLTLTYGQYCEFQPTVTVTERVPETIITSTVTIVKEFKMKGSKNNLNSNFEKKLNQWNIDEEQHFPPNLIQPEERKRSNKKKYPRLACPTTCVENVPQGQFLDNILNVLESLGFGGQPENGDCNQDNAGQDYQQGCAIFEGENVIAEIPVVEEAIANVVVEGDNNNGGVENIIENGQIESVLQENILSTPTDAGGGSNVAMDYLYYDSGTGQITPTGIPENNIFEGSNNIDLNQFTSWTISDFSATTTTTSNLLASTKRAKVSTVSDDAVSMESSEMSFSTLKYSCLIIGSFLVIFL